MHDAIGLPNHDNGEVENVPWVAEVWGGVHDEPQCHDPHDALCCEDHSENYLKQAGLCHKIFEL